VAEGVAEVVDLVEEVGEIDSTIDDQIEVAIEEIRDVKGNFPSFLKFENIFFF
jgi:hypothetical protein